jgi:uncharacterized protein YvpB
MNHKNTLVPSLQSPLLYTPSSLFRGDFSFSRIYEYPFYKDIKGKNSSYNELKRMILVKETIKKRVLLDVPYISQLPNLPRGCEVTALAMLLQHADVSVEKEELAEKVRKDPTPYTKKDGKIYFGNPYFGFVGDMYSFENPGLGVYHGPIFYLAESYLNGKIINFTGQNFQAVYEQLNRDKPVWVIVTSTYAYVPEDFWEIWQTPFGQIKITYKEHSVLITGYDEEYIYFNDPLTEKNRKVLKEDFIAGWVQMGKQAISYID